MQTANKHMKSCIAAVIREMQIKTKRFHFSLPQLLGKNASITEENNRLWSGWVTMVTGEAKWHNCYRSRLGVLKKLNVELPQKHRNCFKI